MSQSKYGSGLPKVLLLGLLLLATAARPVGAGDLPIIEIVPPREITAQRVRIDTLVTSEAIQRVDFMLDGTLVATDRTEPFAARIDARRLSSGFRLEAVAFDESGGEMSRDVLPLTGYATRLAISIPVVREIADTDWWEVTAEVEHSLTAGIDRVDFYRDDHFTASTRRPPFRARIPRDEGAAYLRAVAHMRGGGFTESVRMLGTGGVEDATAVNLVEVYAMVSDRRGRPVTRLERSDFLLHEGEHTRAPDRFAIGDDVPLTVGLVLDRSGSMYASMGRAKQAARAFFEQALDEHDRALLVDFSFRPRLLQQQTDDVESLLARFDEISSEGGSAVYDAVLFTLLRLEATAGRKALIVLTDGLDSGSQVTVEDCAVMARRVGVPIFVISIGERLEHRPVHLLFALQQLAAQSGGKAYTVADEQSIEAVYAEIDQQLRGQYLLAFSTENALAAAELDALHLSVTDRKLKVRTILGGQIQIMD